MEASRGWRIFDRSLVVVGTAFTGVAAWYAYLAYKDLHPVPPLKAPAGGPALVMPPWWAIALLAIGIAMLITAWVRSRAPKSQSVVAPNAKLQEPALGEAVAEQVTQKIKVMDDLAALEKARTYSEGRWRQMYWRIEHDINTPAFAPLNPEDAKWVQRELSKFATVLGELRDALPQIAEDVRQRGFATGSANGASWMGSLLFEHVFRVCERSLNFALEPRNSELDPREAFLAFFLSYRRVREWIQRAAVVFQMNPINIKGYAEWWIAEEKFVAQLKQLPNDSAMKELRDSILNVLTGPT